MKYGHRHLGFVYKHVLTLMDDGLRFEGQHYAWGDIKKIKRHESRLWSTLFNHGGAHLTYIYLDDGKIIKIRAGAIEQRDNNETRRRINGKTRAHRELIDTILDHKKRKEAV